ncbi:hypothetical protein [Roseovarius sp. Pro17]|uniref:hypothetical protein n=1 Tax=Roseovarius sp. Pro17 TaxID=3108175 RepID=UPI002D77E91F|nr:hypothetical protein [Roseovarius sp. Pro17]
MLRIVAIIATTFPALAHAEAFQRPIPQPQSATAEWWFLAASLALLASLLAVHLLVRRR